MLSGTAPHLACRLGRLLSFAQLFERELREEFVFDAATRAFWHDALTLVRAVAEPLEPLAGAANSQGQPGGSDFLAYFHQRWRAARAETAGAVAGRDPVDQIFAALGHLRDARFGLEIWLRSCPPAAEPDGGPHMANELDRRLLDAVTRLDEYRLAGGDNFLLHLLGRGVFLTAAAGACADPDRLRAAPHAKAIRSLRDATDSAASPFHRHRLQQKLALLERLAPYDFNRLTMAPADFAGSDRR